MSSQSLCCKCGTVRNTFFECERGDNLYPVRFYCSKCKQTETNLREKKAASVRVKTMGITNGANISDESMNEVVHFFPLSSCLSF